MKLLTYLVCVFSVLAITHSSVNATVWDAEEEVEVITGFITDYRIENESNVHTAYFEFELDDGSSWEAHFYNNKVLDIGWRVGDHISIDFLPGDWIHPAYNQDKQSKVWVFPGR